MRLRHLSMFIAVASFIGACKAKDNTPPDAGGSSIPANTDWDIPGATADAGMVFRCNGPQNVSFGMNGWRKRLEKKKTIKFVLTASGDDYVKITKVDKSAPWPFVDSTEIVLRNGNSVERARPDLNAQDTIFHYNVVGICIRADATQDTVVIDPIMILPN